MKKHIFILCVLFVLEVFLGFIKYNTTSTLVFENDIYRFVSNTTSKVILKSKDKHIVLKGEDSKCTEFPSLCGKFEVFLSDDRQISFLPLQKNDKYAIIHSDGNLKEYTINYLLNEIYMSTEEYEKYLQKIDIYNWNLSESDNVDKNQKEEIILIKNIMDKRYSFMELKELIIYFIFTVIFFIMAFISIFFISKILKFRDKFKVSAIIFGYIFSSVPIIILIFI